MIHGHGHDHIQVVIKMDINKYVIEPEPRGKSLFSVKGYNKDGDMELAKISVDYLLIAAVTEILLKKGNEHPKRITIEYE